MPKPDHRDRVRYAILIWFTDNPEARERPLLLAEQDLAAGTVSVSSTEGWKTVRSVQQHKGVQNRRGQLVILGSGIASISHFTLETIGYIKGADIVFYHANSGVTASYVRELNSNAVDLYEYYGEDKVRTDTYFQMAELMLRKAGWVCASLVSSTDTLGFSYKRLAVRSP